jgi:hypothetical protein
LRLPDNLTRQVIEGSSLKISRFSAFPHMETHISTRSAT